MHIPKGNGQCRRRFEHSRVFSSASAAAVAAAAIAGWLGADPPQAAADPFWNFTLVGRPQGSSDPFSPTIAVSAGQLIEYQIIGNISPVGTTNAVLGTARTITSLTVGADGANSLSLSLFQLSTDPIQSNFLSPVTFNPDPSPAPNDTWGASGNSVSPGTLLARPGGSGTNDLTNVRATHPAGIFTGVTPEVIATGVFGVVSASNDPAVSLIRARMGPISSALHINGSGLAVFPSMNTETRADPYFRFLPLTLTFQASTGSEWTSASSGNWNDSSNWDAGVPSAAGAAAFFKSAITASRTVTLTAPQTVGTLHLENASASYTFAGAQPLHLDVSGGSAAINLVSGTHAISAPVVLDKSAIINVSPSSGALSVSGAISGSGSINKLGPGTLILTGSNTYTGNTTIAAGTLAVDSDDNLGAGPGGGGIVMNGGTFKANADITTERALTIDAGAGVFDTNGHTITLQGSGNSAHNSNTQLKFTGGGTFNWNRTGGTAAVGVVSFMLIDNATTLRVGGSTDPLGNGTNSVNMNITTMPDSFLVIGGPTTKNPARVQGGAGTIEIESGASLLVNINVDVKNIAVGDNASFAISPFLFSIGAVSTSSLDLAGSTGAWTSKVDLTMKAMAISNGDGATGSGATGQVVTRTVTDQLKQGLNTAGAKWTGNGITSSSAAADPFGRHALGVVQNNYKSASLYAGGYTDGTTTSDTTGFTILSNLYILTPSLSDTVVRYTYFGDADINGQIELADYNLIDAGFASGSKGWINGDFDYSGVIDSTDYQLIDLSWIALHGQVPQSVLNQRQAQFGQSYLDTLVSMAPTVPEPGALSGLGLTAAAGCLRRRRRVTIQ